MRLGHLFWHSLRILAIGLCVEFCFGSLNVALAREFLLAAAERIADNQSQDDDSDVHIPPQQDCLGKMGNWSEPEKWAWQQICARELIDFNTRYGTSNDQDVDGFATDPRRLLSAEFLRQILEDPRFLPHTQSAAIDIKGAYLPTIRIGNTSLGALSIIQSKVGNDIYLDNVTILRSIVVSASHVGDVSLRRIQGRNINFTASTMGDVSMTQLGITRLSLVGVRFVSLAVSISRFSEQLAILGGSSQDKIVLDEVKSDGLFVRPTSAKSISINDYVDTGMFFMEIAKWGPESTLTLHTMTTGRFFLNKALPAKISTSGFTFSGADWGKDPLPQIKQWMAASSEYTPGLYAALATSYLEGGQSGTASDILIAKQNADYAHSDSLFEKTYLFVTWLLADYGFHPEVGLLWILGFVGVATVVFKTGEETLPSESRPRNWLVFAFDSVIPGIQLDSQHKEISFVGWRQYFLYFLRFLSAVVVVLVIELLKKSLSGLG